MEDDTKYKELLEFVKNNRILAIAIAGMLSRYISEIVNSFTTNIIVPVLFDDSDSDDELEDVKDKVKDKSRRRRDRKKIEKNCLEFNGIKFKVGKFVVEFMKFAVMLIITICILVIISSYDLI